MAECTVVVQNMVLGIKIIVTSSPSSNWKIFVANMRFFVSVLSRLLLRHLGFDSDFAQISGQKIGG